MTTPDTVHTAAQFKDKAEVYDQFRPPYPSTVIGQVVRDILNNSYIPHDAEMALPDILASIEKSTDIQIADLGGGTGFLQRSLGSMFQVISIDPEDSGFNGVARKRLHEMQTATSTSDTIEQIVNKPIFLSRILDGKFEQTHLPDQSVDYITMGNSAHWIFADPKLADQRFASALKECNRILKPGGKIYVLFNVVDIDDPQSQELQALFEKIFPKFAGNGNKLFEKDTSSYAHAFMKEGSVVEFHDRLDWKLDKAGFTAWAKTLSFVPSDMTVEQAGALNTFFEEHNNDGTITLKFRPDLYSGSLRQIEKVRVI